MNFGMIIYNKVKKSPAQKYFQLFSLDVPKNQFQVRQLIHRWTEPGYTLLTSGPQPSPLCAPETWNLYYYS